MIKTKNPEKMTFAELREYIDVLGKEYARALAEIREMKAYKEATYWVVDTPDSIHKRLEDAIAILIHFHKNGNPNEPREDFEW